MMYEDAHNGVWWYS